MSERKKYVLNVCQRDDGFVQPMFRHLDGDEMGVWEFPAFECSDEDAFLGGVRVGECCVEWLVSPT